MATKIDKPVSVILASDHAAKKVIPTEVIWNSRAYKIQKLGLHYTYRSGTRLYHVFCVTSDSINFKLTFDTVSLLWELEEVYDELSG